MRKLETIAYHRNGICGEPFYALTFTEDGRNMFAVVFDAEAFNPQVAIFDRDLLAVGNITFGEGNSWRGDHYSNWCTAAISRHNGVATADEDKVA